MSDPTNPFAALSLIVAPAIGAFAAAALTSLVGAALSSTPAEVLPATLEVIALAAGFIGVMGLVLGCVLLLRRTRIAVRVVSEEATHPRNNLAERTRSS